MRKNVFSRVVDAICGIFVCLSISITSYNLARNFSSNTSNQPNFSNGKVLAANIESNFTEPENGPSPNEIFRLVNEQRKRAGAQPLVPNLALTQLAEARAEDMTTRKYYAHKSPDGVHYYDYLAKNGFDPQKYSCENLDLQFALNADQYIEDWLASSSHRNCMLSLNISEAGYAVRIFETQPGEPATFVLVAIHIET